MSLKFANNGRSQWSLTVWLTVWYTVLAFLLIGATTGYSYYILVSYLDREDDEFVSARITDVESRLAMKADGLAELNSLWGESAQDLSTLKIVMRVLSSDGSVLASMRGSDEVPWPTTSFRAVVESNGESSEWSFMARDGTLPSGMKIVIQAALDRRQELTFLTRYRKQLYLMLFLATLACAAGGILIVRRGLQPLKELSDLAASIGSSRMQQRLDSSMYAAELKLVATTFNGMLDRLQASFERLNRFSGDIAHELRTPLHNLRGEIEVTLTKNRKDVEYKDVLGSCLEESIRLSRLVDSLLFLARGDQPKSCLKREKLRIREELATIQDFYDVAAEDRGVSLSVISGEVEMFADRTLFQRVIGNLINNALAHTPRGGRIDICADARENCIQILVKDNGSGIAANDLPFVFDRLYSGGGARTGLSGHGLGLSIVKTIIELHGGSVAITSGEGCGTTVETSWPTEAGNDA